MQAQEKHFGPFIEACKQIKNDISFVIENVNYKQNFASFESAIRRNSGTNEMAAETITAVAMQASIIAYRRPGERNRETYPFMSEATTQMLDQLRDGLSRFEFEDVIRSVSQRSTVLQRGLSLAALALALDVTFHQSADKALLLPSEQKRLLLLAAGLDPQSSDPQGDAQAAAEDHFNDDTNPLFESEDTINDPRRPFREALRLSRVRQCREEVENLYGSQFRAAQIAGKRAVSA